METAGKLLLVGAAALAVLGGLLLLLAKLGVDRLPGDIVIERDNLTIYAPIGLMILISVVASIVLVVVSRLR